MRGKWVGNRFIHVKRSFSWMIQRNVLNLNVGVSISRSACLDPSVRLQLSGPGVPSGGRLTVKGGSRLDHGVFLAPYGGSIFISENVFVGPYCVLYGHGGLNIGRNALIAAHTVIVPSNHTFGDVERPIREQPETREGICIGEDVWIGCGSRILDGVTVGRGSVIGAGSVVCTDIPEYSVAVGVPARVIRSRASEDGLHGVQGFAEVSPQCSRRGCK